VQIAQFSLAATLAVASPLRNMPPTAAVPQSSVLRGRE
jgi:hypothetical protein